MRCLTIQLAYGLCFAVVYAAAENEGTSGREQLQVRNPSSGESKEFPTIDENLCHCRGPTRFKWIQCSDDEERGKVG